MRRGGNKKIRRAVERSGKSRPFSLYTTCILSQCKVGSYTDPKSTSTLETFLRGERRPRSVQ